MFLSLDFIYVPTKDVDAAVRQYVEVLGAELDWKVRGMGTMVARIRLSEEGPAILLSGHLEGERPILIYRVSDYTAAVDLLRSLGLPEVLEVEIPHGPCASFRMEGGQRVAVYELLRPEVDEHFRAATED
jgi:catechol 2,3-dioxygenase-like lactoylglutathione lyase family enzyme